MPIGEKIKQLRQQLGLEQQELAEFWEIPVAQVIAYETNQQSNVDISLIEKLCDLAGLPFFVFLSELDFAPRCLFAKLPDLVEHDAVSLTALADINRIALNIQEIKDLLAEA